MVTYRYNWKQGQWNVLLDNISHPEPNCIECEHPAYVDSNSLEYVTLEVDDV